MQNRFITWMLVFLLAGLAHAQDDKEKFKARYESLPADSNFDPHDLSGIWTLTKNDHSLGTPAPPLTPAGVAAMAGRIVDKAGVIGNAPWYTCNPMGFRRLLNDDEPMEFIVLRTASCSSSSGNIEYAYYGPTDENCHQVKTSRILGQPGMGIPWASGREIRLSSIRSVLRKEPGSIIRLIPKVSTRGSKKPGSESTLTLWSFN